MLRLLRRVRISWGWLAAPQPRAPKPARARGRPLPTASLVPDPPSGVGYRFDADATFGAAGPFLVFHGSLSDDTSSSDYVVPLTCGMR